MMRLTTLPCVFCLLSMLAGVAAGQDWPGYMCDNARSGVTEAQLQLPLKPAWTFKPLGPPAPAWPGPARQDFFHDHFDLRATVTYDRAFHAVVAADTVYFGSSCQDKIYALDAETGVLRWTFLTGGPVRFAPVFSNGNLYAGSDDGCVYCLAADDGTLIWKRRIAPAERVIPGNGRMISLWPIRTGMLVDEGTVYCTAGLFPQQGAFLAALDARTGSERYRQRIAVSPQGYLLASRERLYVPTGRTSPAVFSRDQGTPQGRLASAGGAYALLSRDVLVTGPGRGPKQLHAGDVQTKDTIATFDGLRMIVRGSTAYMQSERRLAAFDRDRYLRLSRQRGQLQRRRDALRKALSKMPADQPQAEQTRRQVAQLGTQISKLDAGMNACYLWTVGCDDPYAMIVAAQTILVGGDGEVAAIDSSNGKVLWTGEVTGKAFGLCVADAALYVSTDMGYIHCFRHAAPATPETVNEGSGTNLDAASGLAQRDADAVDRVLREVASPRGYCLILNCGEGRLACELARRTQLKVIGVEPDGGKVEAARRLFDEAGLAGRATVRHLTGPELPFTSYFANVVIVDGAAGAADDAASLREIVRVVRPYGGILVVTAPVDAGRQRQLRQWGLVGLPDPDSAGRSDVAWACYRREPLDGSGEWTHMYAEPGNSACSGDTLVRGRVMPQWFGEPGPRQMIDRHHRNISPLFKDGRLFVPGDCVVFAVDAYNGTVLWRTEVPNSRRLGAFLDASSMAVDERLLYVAAGDKCHTYDVRSGRREASLTMPQRTGDKPHNWGYVAYVGPLVFGSGCKPDASYTETSHKADNALWHRNMKLVTSEYLFAKDKRDDTLLWTYRDGVILNTTIAAGDGRIYFVQTHSPEALGDATGRMPVKTLFAGGDQYLTALDQRTGQTIFKKKIHVGHFEEPVYLNVARGVLVLSGSRLGGKSIYYYYDAFDAETGAERWHAAHDSGLPIDGGHGEYNRHPTIVGDTIYAWPYAYALKTGERIDTWKFDRRGHGCGGVSASARCLFWRGGNPWMYDLGPDGGPARLNTVTRPGCWINMLPVGGLVLIPEASSGCTCGFSLQTSLAYIPESSLK